MVCKKCNGYYRLEDDESPEDFECCECGGDLILVEDNYEYYQYEDCEYDLDSETNRRDSLNKKTFFILALCIIIPLILLTDIIPYSSHDQTSPTHLILGSDSRGQITKDIYSDSYAKSAPKTIAIVTGMHPREKLSKTVVSTLIKNYPLSSNFEIVHYDIRVTDNPDDYIIGRNNGEGLAADYILQDVLKSDDDLIIICHDHEPGYGEGFYIATPQMDEGSVKLAESVNQSIPGFNYYRADNIREHTTSATRFSKPMASAGYKTFVYEIPEWIEYNEAHNMTYELINKCFNLLSI